MGNSINIKPIIGNFVSCYFPYEENTSKLGPTLRPTLVVGFIDAENLALVAYCSAAKSSLTTKSQSIQDWQIEIGLSQINGLTEITRVDFKKMLYIPWTDEWFAVQNGKKSIVIGSLDSHHRNAANAAKQIGVDCDISNPHKVWGKKLRTKDDVNIVIRRKIQKPPTDDLSDVT